MNRSIIDPTLEGNNMTLADEAKRWLRNGTEITSTHAIALLREIVDRDYGGVRACARSWKVSAPYLSDCLNERRPLGPAILNKLGLRKVVTVGYRVP